MRHEEFATNELLKAATTEAFEFCLIGSVLLDAPDGIKAYPDAQSEHFANRDLGRIWAAIRSGYGTAQELIDLGYDKSLISGAVCGAIEIMHSPGACP
jgi:hypothetical protein